MICVCLCNTDTLWVHTRVVLQVARGDTRARCCKLSFTPTMLSRAGVCAFLMLLAAAAGQPDETGAMDTDEEEQLAGAHGAAH